MLGRNKIGRENHKGYNVLVFEKLVSHFAPHHHSGRLVHHRNTSYASLALILMLASLVLATFSYSAAAYDPAELPPPVQEDLDVHATVPGPLPKSAPTIQAPPNGQTVSAVPISVLGNCQKDTLVKLFKNDIFAGAVLCDGSGAYKLSIDLLIGGNTLTAQSFNALDKGGPVSGKVAVTYNLPEQTAGQAPGVLEPSKTPANQVLINTLNYHRGVRIGEELTWPLELVGGTPPYAVSVGWGDGKTDLISRGTGGRFDIRHRYAKPGNGYRGSHAIIVKATDTTGATGYIQLVIIVGGNADPLATASGVLNGKLGIAWPLIIILALVVISFFLGERREKFVLRQKGLI